MYKTCPYTYINKFKRMYTKYSSMLTPHFSSYGASQAKKRIWLLKGFILHIWDIIYMYVYVYIRIYPHADRGRP